ncbi:MAG: MFS transporter [Planctomycetota bacterium]
MTSIAVVRKGRTAAVAVDTLSKQGSCLVPSRHKTYPSKIVEVGGALLASAGSIALLRTLESVARHHADEFRLGSIGEVYETFRRLHGILVDEYHLMTAEDDDDQPFESSQVNLLIAAPSGIYEVQSYREVQQYNHFWATGSGYRYALGSLESIYDESDEWTATEIARRAVEVACVFDDASDGPVVTAEVGLTDGR